MIVAVLHPTVSLMHKNQRVAACLTLFMIFTVMLMIVSTGTLCRYSCVYHRDSAPVVLRLSSRTASLVFGGCFSYVILCTLCKSLRAFCLRLVAGH